jgi:hypothetical protein
VSIFFHSGQWMAISAVKLPIFFEPQDGQGMGAPREHLRGGQPVNLPLDLWRALDVQTP